MTMTLHSLEKLLNGTLSGATVSTAQAITLSGVSINSRTLIPGDLYIAIKGQVYDGHDFVNEAVKAGAIAVIVQHNVTTSVPVITVADTHQALGQLASAWRQTEDIQVAGVTGSNGKTTVKEMLAAILGVNAPVLYTQGNLNNDIGVPLTLLKILPHHRYAVIEMGANHAGEIAYTSALAKADVVIITNIGDAHLEGFGSIEGIAQAKGEIIETLKADGVAILNRDDRFYTTLKSRAGSRNSLSFGFRSDADVTAKNLTTQLSELAFNTHFTLVTPTASMPITLHLAGRHNVLNALAASAAAIALGIKGEQIQQGLASLQPVKGRLQPLRGANGNCLIDDSYNANPSSLAAALEALANCTGELWLALGAFGELGPDSLQIHAELAPLIKQHGVTRLFATGTHTQATVNEFGAGADYFNDQVALINAIHQELKPTVTLLIKGSRSQRMENVAVALMDLTGK